MANTRIIFGGKRKSNSKKTKVIRKTVKKTTKGVKRTVKTTRSGKRYFVKKNNNTGKMYKVYL